jgi:UDP-glucose 4-epimerase
MKIGITGATGFIGSYLSRYLVEHLLPPTRLFVRSQPPPVHGPEVLRGDLLRPADCERFAAGLDVIYYLAHVNSPVNSDVDPAHDAAVNLVPFLNLLHAVQKLGTKPHIVYFSSGGAVYEPRPNAIYRETDLCAPGSSYGIQKLAAEHYLRVAAETGKLTAVVLRVGNAYGTPLPEQRLQGLIGVAVNSVLHDRPVRIFGNPENVRDYIHLDDLCAFARLAAVSRQVFDVFNVGTGVGHSVAEVLRIVEELHGDKLRVVSDVSIGAGLVDRVVLDILKSRLETGWAPRIGLRAGIQAMLVARRRELALSVETS